MSDPNNLSKEEAYCHALRGYVTGLIAAIVLTVIPFGAVAVGIPTGTALWIIMVLGLIQIVVHVHYFLHVDLNPERRPELHLLLFSVLLLFIMAVGTLWVVFNMNYRMMPGMNLIGM
jgi:cytochrome o ubiquinol oxidase operon protein cyoD